MEQFQPRSPLRLQVKGTRKQTREQENNPPCPMPHAQCPIPNHKTTP
ncbi:hypothetical protein IQ246_19650 [aff. Roholtiella sp. LEGE 12411]|nr:hypothetical protein [aff. Roholtiella sp. LEGE 12411]